MVVISIVFTYLAEFYFNFLKNKKYLNQVFGDFYAKPYLRIFMQQFLAIIPFLFLFVANYVGVIAALLLIIMRTILDLYINQLAKNPEKIKKLSCYLSKNKPEDFEKTEKLLTTFLD